jgi:outer membrane protein assembly factor BamE (lipoprotein component of BamABCDE complex)
MQRSQTPESGMTGQLSVRRDSADAVATNAEPASRASWVDALVWSAGVLAALGALFAITPRSRRIRGTADAAALSVILGRTKQQIVRTLGPPPGAGPTRSNSWQADTWYYPFNRLERSAVAIQFAHNRAARIELIGPLAC